MKHLNTYEDFINESVINEAKMDKSFIKDWEKSCKALQNHIKYELDKIKGRERILKKDDILTLEEYLNNIQVAMNIPTQLAEFVGLTESLNEAANQIEYTIKTNKNFNLFDLADALKPLGAELLASAQPGYTNTKNYNQKNVLSITLAINKTKLEKVKNKIEEEISKYAEIIND